MGSSEPSTERALSRRRLLQAAGATAAAGTVGTAGGLGFAAPAAAALPTPARADVGAVAFGFGLGQVTLLASRWKQNADRELAYLKYLDADRMLYTFRANVGLSTNGAAPVGGWEAPNGELRGHAGGHLLSGLAQAYASTGDAAILGKSQYLVAELAKCQAASPNKGFHAGYLSAFPESFFDRLESGTSVWAPFYTLHKIYQGLLDLYLLTGNAQALSVATAAADWVDWRSARWNSAQLANVLRVEFGGINDFLALLSQVVGNSTYLTTAARFDDANFYTPLANNQDNLAGRHGNTQLARVNGAMRQYLAGAGTRYRTISGNFFDLVVRHHSYAIGGNTDGEYFQPPDQVTNHLSDSTCEVCNTYNLLKLGRQLFFQDPARVDIIEWYERAMLNQILGQQDPDDPHGGCSYYIPLRAGGIQDYSDDYDSFWCDTGTGFENHTKLQESVYFRGADGSLYVNLFIPTTLDWAERGFRLTQTTDLPLADTVTFTVGAANGRQVVRFRIPSWAQGPALTVNGSAVAVTAGTYAVVDRTWAAGDTVILKLPMGLAFEPAPDDASVVALRYGPTVLAGNFGSSNPGGLPALDRNSVRSNGKPAQFTATVNGATVTLSPFYDLHHVRYSVYFTTAAQTPTYGLQNKKSGLVLGIEGMSTANGGRALQWGDTGTADHNWRRADAGGGSSKLVNVNSGKVLGVSGMSTADGAQVLQWDDNGTADHLWQFVDAGGGWYRIVNRNSGKALAVAGGSTSAGALVVQQPNTGADDRLWKLLPR